MRWSSFSKNLRRHIERGLAASASTEPTICRCKIKIRGWRRTCSQWKIESS